MSTFNYKMAFSRNLGWITEDEQNTLQQKRVAIAGVGGVGGHYCEVLARLGIQKFTIADFDVYELANFNRQNTSGMKNLNRSKTDSVRERILDINPNADVRVFTDGIHSANIEDFVADADLYIDGLDFFVLDERFKLFKILFEKNIPAMTIAPVGMGASLMLFAKGSMSFEEYFGFNEETPLLEKALRFLVGLTPSMMHVKYLVDRSKANFAEKKAPSTAMGCYLCAGIGGTMALKVLLGRGPIKMAPWVLHFDSYLQKYKCSYVWLGAKNPLQKIKTIIARRILIPQVKNGIKND